MEPRVGSKGHVKSPPGSFRILSWHGNLTSASGAERSHIRRMSHTPHILAVLASLAVLALVTFVSFGSLVAFASIFTLVAFLAFLAFVAFATFLRILAVVAFPTSIGLVAFATFLAFGAVLTVVAPFTLVAVATWTAREPHSGADSSAERGTVARSTIKPIETAVEEAPQQAAHKKGCARPRTGFGL